MNDENDNKSSEAKQVQNIRTEAYCSVNPTAKRQAQIMIEDDRGKSVSQGIKDFINKWSKKKQDIKERLMQEGPKPSDFGDHSPIPPEAIVAVALGSEEDKE